MRQTWLAALAVVACGPMDRPSARRDAGGLDTGKADTGVADSGETDAGEMDAGAISVPDPGTAMDDWGFSVNFGSPCCDTPETAYLVGVVTMNPGYVQGDIDTDTLDFFYVFRAGPAYSELTWIGGGIDLEYVDLHDAAGLVFGPIITPIETMPTGGRWAVTPNGVYVLHLHANTGGFF